MTTDGFWLRYERFFKLPPNVQLVLHRSRCSHCNDGSGKGRPTDFTGDPVSPSVALEYDLRNIDESGKSWDQMNPDPPILWIGPFEGEREARLWCVDHSRLGCRPRNE